MPAKIKQQKQKQKEPATSAAAAAAGRGEPSAVRLCPKSGDILVSLHVRPGAKVSQLVAAESDDRQLYLSVAAPPVDGQANTAVVAFVAEALGCRRADVSLEAGAKSRDKLLRVAASAGQTVESALGALTLRREAT